MAVINYNITNKVIDLISYNNNIGLEDITKGITDELNHKVSFSDSVYVYLTRTLLVISSEPIVNAEYYKLLEGSIKDFKTMLNAVIQNIVSLQNKKVA